MTTTAICCATCGAPVEDLDDAPTEGMFAKLLASLPQYCAECRTAQELEHERAQGEVERARHAERLRQRLHQLPPALREHTLDTLDIQGRETALTAASDFAAGNRRGLAFIGPVGTGKTTMAAATICSYLAADGEKAVRWLSVPRAVAVLGRDFGDTERASVLDALTERASVLVLDDIDKSKPSRHVAEILFSAIDTCLTHQRPLLVTTNLMPSRLAALYPEPHGEAIVSRLVGYTSILKLAGRDRRIPPQVAA